MRAKSRSSRQKCRRSKPIFPRAAREDSPIGELVTRSIRLCLPARLKFGAKRFLVHVRNPIHPQREMIIHLVQDSRAPGRKPQHHRPADAVMRDEQRPALAQFSHRTTRRRSPKFRATIAATIGHAGKKAMAPAAQWCARAIARSRRRRYFDSRPWPAITDRSGRSSIAQFQIEPAFRAMRCALDSFARKQSHARASSLRPSNNR